jgi:hypothetical protein
MTKKQNISWSIKQKTEKKKKFQCAQDGQMKLEQAISLICKGGIMGSS